MSVTFIARKRKNGNVSIFCSITYKCRVLFPTNLIVPEKDWDKSRWKFKGDYYYENEMLRKMEYAGNDAINYFKSKFIKPNKSEIIEKFELYLKGETTSEPLLSDLGNLYIKDHFPHHSRSRNSTNKKHLRTIKLLVTASLNIKASDLDMDFYNNLLSYCKNVKNYMTNTTGGHIKNIKAWMNYANYLGLTRNTKHKGKAFIQIREETEAIYLSEKERSNT